MSFSIASLHRPAHNQEPARLNKLQSATAQNAQSQSNSSVPAGSSGAADFIALFQSATGASASGVRASSALSNSSSAATPVAGNTNASSGAADLITLFQSGSGASASAATASAQSSSATAAGAAIPSTNGPAGQLFGSNPWDTDPTGNGPGGITHYNPEYFATEQTAETVARMVGGTVVPGNTLTSAPGSPFTLNQTELMVQLPNGGLINPGLIASLFTHNWPQTFVDQQIANEVNGALPAVAAT
jgi:hypothetical protein